MSSMAIVPTRTKWNSRKFNYSIPFVPHLLWRRLHMCVSGVDVCVLKVKNPHQKYTVNWKRNEILPASENGKIIHMKQTTHSRTICTRNGGAFFIFCERVCARAIYFISFQSTFPCISSQHSPHFIVRYMCTVYSFSWFSFANDFFFRNVYVSLSAL